MPYKGAPQMLLPLRLPQHTKPKKKTSTVPTGFDMRSKFLTMDILDIGSPKGHLGVTGICCYLRRSDLDTSVSISLHFSLL